AIVAGARPNFMKIAPIARALRGSGNGLAFSIVHTGQHYDHEMNGVFFEELGIPPPEICFESGGGSPAQAVLLEREHDLRGLLSVRPAAGFETDLRRRVARSADREDH